MSDSVKIKRGQEKGSVLRQFLAAFVADGWEEDNGEHADKIAAFLDKEGLERYVKEHFGADLDKRSNLESMKEKALALIPQE